MKLIGYSKTHYKCDNCGRHRVEEWIDENGNVLLICEKCNWDQDSKDYFDWDEVGLDV